jgi:hypothetical protein
MVEPEVAMPTDVFSTAPTPKPDHDKATQQALPKQDHPWEENSQLVDQAFWSKIETLSKENPE